MLKHHRHLRRAFMLSTHTSRHEKLLLSEISANAKLLTSCKQCCIASVALLMHHQPELVTENGLTLAYLHRNSLLRS